MLYHSMKMAQQGLNFSADISGPSGADGKKGSEDPFVAQFFVFRGEAYLGWDCFYKEKVSIGRSAGADLILNDDQVSDNHAFVCFEGDRVILTDQTSGDGVFVNHRPVKTVVLKPLDFVNIGPYTIKIKVRRNQKQALDPVESIPAIPLEIDHTDIHPEAKENQETRLAVPQHTDPQRTNRGKNRIEGQVVEAAPEDTGNNDQGSDYRRYRLVFGGGITGGHSFGEVRKNLEHVLRANETQIRRLFSGKQVVIKEDVDYRNAIKLRDTLEKAGAISKIEPIEGGKESIDAPVLYDSGLSNIERIVKGGSGEGDSETESIFNAQERHEQRTYEEDDEAEEDDDEMDVRFSLRERLADADTADTAATAAGGGGRILVEVIKCRGSRVIDVCFLSEGKKYFIKDEKRRFRLAENTRSKGCLFYFTDQLAGSVRSSDSTVKKTGELQNPERLYRKRKGIYRDVLPQDGEVIISDGVFEYLLHRIIQGQSPTIKEPPKKEKTFHKFIARSCLFHLIFLIFVGFFHSLPSPDFSLPPETRFVELDTGQFSEIKKKTAPVQDKKPTEVQPQPQKKQAVRKPEQKPTKVASAKQQNKTKRAVSQSPKAGGGYGKGNILNRDVNQTGLLSMLGDSVGIQPQIAMAAVTNLDAVSTSQMSEGNFKVGGIVGKLGSAKIEVPRSGIVNTKGSTQVLRSGGANGEGMIAALEKGKTGQKQVMGMVTAHLNKTVQVRGGMSREAVKRVIDQHLEEISYCYETALLSNPSIIGKIVFEWKILRSGSVGEIKIKSSSINSTEIHSCIKSSIKTWLFPEPKGSEVIVSYPFIFDVVGF
jgi:hypothetical protein